MFKMKKMYFIGLLFLTLSCKNATDKLAGLTKSNDPIDIMFNDLMQPEAGGMFRGLDFDMDIVTVEKVELARKTSTKNNSEKEGELFITTDLGKEVLDFADLKYNFDDKGLYVLSAEGYITTEEKSKAFYKKLSDYYTTKHGAGKLAADGYMDFEGKTDKMSYQVSLKEINYPPTETEKGSYGFSIIYSIL